MQPGQKRWHGGGTFSPLDRPPPPPLVVLGGTATPLPLTSAHLELAKTPLLYLQVGL